MENKTKETEISYSLLIEFYRYLLHFHMLVATCSSIEIQQI